MRSSGGTGTVLLVATVALACAVLGAAVGWATTTTPVQDRRPLSAAVGALLGLTLAAGAVATLSRRPRPQTGRA